MRHSTPVGINGPSSATRALIVTGCGGPSLAGATIVSGLRAEHQVVLCSHLDSLLAGKGLKYQDFQGEWVALARSLAQSLETSATSQS